MVECIPPNDMANIREALEDHRYNTLKALSIETEPSAQEMLGLLADSIDETITRIGIYSCPI